jgi:dTDP-4-amino-4,6-dideoxy-D-galactose acyltransferase
MKTKLLDWDSQHFGYKIGCITCSPDTPEYLLKSMLIKESSSYKLIYIFLSENTTFSPQLFEKLNILLVDQKIIFRKELTPNLYVESKHNQIESVMQQDYSPFIGLAITSGQYSRFRLDVNFSKSEFEYLYETWIKNSINGQIADNCFVYFEEQHPLGIVTVKIEKDFASIGIIAVDENFRGKGVGYQLLYAAEKYAYENGCQEITVATQKQNLDACHFYTRNGYLVEKTTNVYHFWNNDYYPLQ